MPTENALFDSCINQVAECYASADKALRDFGDNEVGLLMAQPYYTAVSRILAAMVNKDALATYTQEQKQMVIDLSIAHVKKSITHTAYKPEYGDFTPPTLY